ncbi:proline racemase family protein [Euzebya pacifica]|nr:proline racemase family protein [Euzebya pacifica]
MSPSPAPRPRAMTVQTHDYHTGGEPFRIVTGGIPPIGGSTVLQRRAWIAEHLDHVRQLLVNEPRGHADMYGGFVVPPDDDGADLGVVFFHNEGYSTACGHGTIALATWAVESGIVPVTGDVVDVVIDVPSGRLPTRVHVRPDGTVEQVVFTNVPSFVKAHVGMEVHGIAVDVDIAFGGAFYAILPAAAVDLEVVPEQLDEIIVTCRSIKDALNASEEFVHPDIPELRDIYGVILVDELEDADDGSLRQRNVTVFADGEVDRSATGSGTSARLALLHRQGVLDAGRMLHNHSIVGSVMTGAVSAEATVGDYPAVVTHVGGQAFPTGMHTFVLRPDDPIGTGFLLR